MTKKSSTCTLPDLTKGERNPPIIEHLRTVLPDVFKFMAKKAGDYNKLQKKRGNPGRVHSSGIGGYMKRCNKQNPKVASLHAHARAADIYLYANDSLEKMVGDGLFYMFINHYDELGVDEVVWNKEKWSRLNPAVAKASKHTDHVHVGFTSTGALSSPTNLKKYCIGVRLEVMKFLRSREAVGQ